jgi:hypothetical protein
MAKLLARPAKGLLSKFLKKKGAGYVFGLRMELRLGYGGHQQQRVLKPQEIQCNA